MAKSVPAVPKGTKSLARRLYTGKSPAPTGKTVAGQYVQSTCRGLGWNPVWSAHCVQPCDTAAPWGHYIGGYLQTTKKIIRFSPMNKYEPKAENRRCVQHNQTAYESSQPGASPLDDFQPGFGDQSTMFFLFLWLEERWILGVSSSSWRAGEGGWEPLGWETLQDHGAHCSRGPLSPGKVDSLMGILGLFSCKTRQRLLETQSYEGTHR